MKNTQRFIGLLLFLGASVPACSAEDSSATFEQVTTPVIFDTNDRREAGALTSTELKWANATGSLMPSTSLDCRPDGSCSIRTQPWQYIPNDPTAVGALPLCSTQKEYNQAKAEGRCSAFLVTDSIAATAGHCFNATFTCDKLKLAFGFYADAAGRNATTSLPKDNIYSCAELIRDSDSSTLGDWAVFRLDRPVIGRTPLKVAQGRRPGVGTPLVLLGYPMSLPLKLSTNGNALGDAPSARFDTNLEALPGNSGGPILRPDTGEVVGILTDGPDLTDGDWEKTPEGCLREQRCSAANGCEVPAGTLRYTLGTEVQRAAITAGLNMTCHLASDCSSGYCNNGRCEIDRFAASFCESTLCQSGTCNTDNSRCAQDTYQANSNRGKLDSVAAIFARQDVTCAGANCSLKVAPFDSARLFPGYVKRAVCSDELFRGQPQGGLGTAFLVAPDLVATAGHLVPNQSTCDTLSFVFGFTVDYGDANGPATVSAADVYNCGSVIESHTGAAGSANWALVRLTRPVPQGAAANARRPVSLDRNVNLPAVGIGTLTAGYPLGLPGKVHISGRVKSAGVDSPSDFRLSNGLFRGSAGSPVYATSGGVIGIVTDGPEVSDFFTDVTSSGGLCMRQRRCDTERGCDAQKPFGIANSIAGLRQALAQLQ